MRRRTPRSTRTDTLLPYSTLFRARRARESSEMQRILFQHAVRYDANELQSSFAMGLAHLRAFVFGMLTAAGGSVRDSRFYPGRAWRLELPDALVAAIPGLGRDPLVTFARNLGAERGKVLLLEIGRAHV